MRTVAVAVIIGGGIIGSFALIYAVAQAIIDYNNRADGYWGRRAAYMRTCIMTEQYPDQCANQWFYNKQYEENGSAQH